MLCIFMAKLRYPWVITRYHQWILKAIFVGTGDDPKYPIASDGIPKSSQERWRAGAKDLRRAEGFNRGFNRQIDRNENGIECKWD